MTSSRQAHSPTSSTGLLAFTALLVAACSPDEPVDPRGALVGIGAVIDQTGSVARPAWRDAAELAIEHANEGLALAGGLDDLVFALRFSDSTSIPSVASERAARLVREHGVVGIVSDTTTDTVAIGAAMYDSDPDNDLGVPLVCMACASPELNDPLAAHPSLVTQRTLRDRDGWIFRAAADANPESIALLNAAYELAEGGDLNRDGTWKIAVYVIDDELGNAYFESIRRARDRLYPRSNPDGSLRDEGLQLEIVRHPANIDANTYDWQSDLARLVDERNEEPQVNPLELATGEPIPEVVFDGRPDTIIEVTAPLFAASITRAYLEAGDVASAIRFLHHHNWRHDTTLVKLITLDIEGQEGISHAPLDNCDSSGAIFQDAFLERGASDVGLWDAHTYDATMSLQLAVLIAVVENGLTDPSQVTGDQVRAALPKTAGGPDAVPVVAGPAGFAAAVEAIRAGRAIDYVGASGPVDFDAEGNVRNDFVRYRLVGARFETELVYGCVADPETCATRAEVCD